MPPVPYPRRLMYWLLSGLTLLALLAAPVYPDTTFQSLPERLAGNQWRLTWTTEPGQRYLLQRSPDLSRWDTVAEITAEAAITSFTDAGVPAQQPQTFWRAIRQGGPDTSAPVVSILQIRRLSSDGQTLLELTVQAEDNVGVVGVGYREGAVQLGAATQGPAGTWKRVVPIDPGNSNPRQFQAVASDAAGNTGFSDIFTFIPTIQSQDLIPLDRNGQPLGDSLVGLKPDGTLNPFTYLPDLNGGGSTTHAMRIDFPDGGNLVAGNGGPFVEGRRMVIGFGEGSPTQFIQPSTGLPGPLTLQAPPGQTLRVPRGPLSYQTLAALLGVPPTGGIALQVHGKSEVLWTGGTLTRTGIRGGTFRLLKPAMTLPGVMGGYEKETVDLTRPDPIGFSIHGNMRLGKLAQLTIPRARPLSLHLLPGGGVTLTGCADLLFDDGARFSVEVFLDDPVYSLSLRAGNVEVPLMGSLADLLPDDPASCIPGGSDKVALDHAAACLEAHARAYRFFIAAARGLRPDGPGDAVVQSVPDAVDLTGAALEAWATLRAADLTNSLPLQELQQKVESLSRQTRGGGSTPVETIQAVAQLTNLRRTIAPLNAADLTTQAQDAIRAAKPALLKALEDPAVLSRDALGTIVLTLSTGEFDFDQEISAAAASLLARAVAREASAVGVVAGVTDSAANPVLSAQNPYVVRATLRRLADIESAAENAGRSVLELPLFNECFQQIFDHGYTTCLTSLNKALDERNPLGAMIFVGELQDIQSFEQLSAVEILASPSNSTLQTIITRASTLMEQAIGASPQTDPDNPVTRDQVFATARQLESVMELAARIPNGDPLVQSVASLAFQRLELLLPDAVSPTALAAVDNEDELLLYLDAGILHTKLKRRFPTFTGVFNWEGPPVGDVAARLADIAITTGDSALISKVSRRLLDTAGELENLASDRPSDAVALRFARKRYLIVAADTLADLHPLSIIEWNATESRRGSDPAAVSADGFLPGDLKIDRLFGAVKHNRLSGKTEGRFGGQLRLPKLDSALTIHGASIDSDGRFDLTASGALRLPGTPDAPIVSLTIPRSQPLHLALAPGQAPVMEGRARLAFDNGASVGVGLRFADPIYTFQAEAGGLQTGLRDALLAVQSPQVGSLNLSPLWADYYDSLGTWLEGFEGTDEPSGAGEADDFPAYPGHVPGDVTSLLQAWLARALAEVQAGGSSFIVSSNDVFRSSLDRFASGLTDLADSFNEMFPPSAEAKAQDLLKQLKCVAEIQKQMAELLDKMARSNLNGGSYNPAALQPFFQAANDVVDDAVETLRQNPALLARPDLVKTVSKAALDNAAARQLAGENSTAQLEAAKDLLREGTNAYNASKGLLPNGTVDSAILGALSAKEIEETLREFMNMHSLLLLAGDTGGPNAVHLSRMAEELARATLDEVGFVAVSGLVDDSGPDEKLLAAIRRLHMVYVDLNPLLNAPLSIPSSLTFTAFLLHNECMDRSKRLARDEWYQRYQLLTGASFCRALRLAAGGQPLEDVDIAREDQIMLQAFAQQGTGRLDPEEVELMRVLEERRSTPQVAGIFNSRILEAASQLFTATTPPWVSDDVAQGKILLEEIAELDRLAGGAFPFAAQRDPASLLARVRQRMAESSAAARKTTPPAVVARFALQMADPPAEIIQTRNLLGPQSTAIRDAVDPDTKPVSQTPAFETALRTESAGLLNASRAVLADRADDARPPSEPDLALPGDLVVDRVFGGFYFNRLTGFFRGNFGGKLLFPDPRASFEIVEAVFDSTGAFNITAGTGIPVKVMGNDRSTLTATLSVAGSPLGLQSVGGTGSLTVPFGPDQPGNPGTRSYNGTFSYQPNQPGKPLTFTAAVDGVQNEFKLGNDFALFDGQVALTFATARPELTLQLGGRAGFFAREGAPPALGAEGKFWVVCAIDKLALAVTPDKIRATFNGGSLKLAQDLFQSDLPGGDGFVRFDLAGTLGVDYTIPTGGLNFFGNNNPAEPFRVAGSGFRFRVPGIADSLITVDTCALEFFQNRFPVLTELDASFRFPLPGLNAADPSQRVPEFGLNVQGWGVDGFPPDAATITLNNGLSLMDLDGLDIELLGQNVGAFPPVALTLLQVEEGGQTFTRMELEGGMRVGIDSGLITPKPGTNPTSPQILTTTPGSMRATVAGDFGWTFKPGARPTLSLEEVLIEGNFLLGGSLEISGVNGPTASLRIRGFEDLFVRNNPADPFSIELSAAVGFANIGKFQLQGARFVWRDPASGIPDFDVAGAGAVLGDSLSTLLGEGMPVYVKSVFLEFLQTAGRPLIGSPGNPGRFDLDNIRLTLTAGAEFPPAPPIQIDGETPELDELPPSGPRFGGEITNLRVSFPSGNPLLPDFQLDSVRMGIQGLDIPPLKGLTGQVALLNLDQLRADPPRPDRVTFAGELGADFNGTGVSVLLAASPSQLHGAALTVNVPVGIPLDGGVVGGILWKGASGGIHFKNSFEDPTEFKTFLIRDGSGNFTGAKEFPPAGNPGTNTTNVEDPLQEVEIASGEDSIYVKPDLPPAPGQQFDPFDVLQDNWPPQAANPLLEEFPPGSGRLVFKGSRMTASAADSFLNSIGVVPGDTRTAEQIIQVFLTNLTVGVRTEADNAVNVLLTVSQMQGNAGIRSHYQALTNRLIDSFDDIVRPILRGILQPVGLAGGPSVRQQMHDLLTNGIPGFNVTFLGSGTFSHTAVAPVMDLKGTISASTTGAALSRGELRIAGIPVAEASLGLSLTKEVPAPTPENPDAKKAVISPFFGGLARVGIGPLQMGKVTMSAKFPDAAAIVTHFDQYLQCTTSALSVAAAGQFRLLAENAIGAQVPAGTSLQAFLLARTDAEKIAVTGALFEYFAQSAKGTLGSQFVLAQQDFNTLLNCFATFVSNSLNSLTPELGFGGKIEPSIFDIPMTTSGMPLASARMRYGPVLRAPTGNESPVNDLLANPSAFLDPAAPPGVREFSAYLQFSPSAMLLAPLTGTFVAINPTNAAFAGFTALDFAEFGFSFQQTAWTPEKVILFLTNPVQHYANTTDEFFKTAVFAAGYQLSPFGMDLADGQLRLVFPDTQLHPLRPGGSNISRRNHPIDPINPAGARTQPLPTTDEVILAALTAGKIKDATYRGEPGELAELFPVPPPVGSESPDGNVARIQKISRELRSSDATLAALNTKSFAKDYFPYGGIIGGGQLALPRLLTKGLPPSWGDLFIPNQNAAAWLTSFAAFAEDLSSTETVGQLAYYIPAPNPVLLPGENPATVWSGLTIESLLGRLKMDPASLIGRSINTDLYELDEIVLAGWAEADLLGIPLGDARLKYDGDARRLEARADIKPGSWFGDFFTGKATFAVQLPSDQETGLVTYSTSQLFDHIGNNISGLSGPQLQARVTEIQQSLAGALPRISATVDAGVTIPPAFADFVRGGANVGFFAYSPYFDPNFQPANDRPEAIAKRQGGIGVKGALQVGYFSPDGNAANDVFVNVADASLALSVPTGAGPPGLSGNLEITTGSMPIPLGPLGSTSLTNLRLALNTDPTVGNNFLLASGNTPSVNLGGFMRIDPLSGSNVGADFVVKRVAGTGLPSAGLALRPAKLTFPGLADNTLDLRIHGTDGESSDFTLTTAGDFGAAVTLRGGMTLSDPFNNQPLLTLAGPTAPITGSLSRTSGVVEISFILPTGFSAKFHPLGQTYTFNSSASLKLRNNGTFDIDIKSSDALEVPDFFRIGPPAGGTSQLLFTRNDGGIAKLRIQAPQLTLFPGNNGLKKPTFALPDLIEIESTGRFYVNSGSRTMDLFGAVQASGNLEFGYEPADPTAAYAFTKSTTSRTFGNALRGRAATLPLVINNTGTSRLPLALELSGSGAANYHLSHSSLNLAVGASQSVSITFIAKGNSNPATLTLRPLSGNALPQTVSLSAGTTTPSTVLGDLIGSDATLFFGQLSPGLAEARSSLLINTGLAPVNISSVTVPSGVTIQGSVNGTLAPGESRVVPLVYQPTAAGTTSGSLSYNTTAGTRTAAVAGTAVNRNFIKVLSTSRPFASLSMTGDFGTAVDVDGKTWRTTNQGVTWKPESIPSLPVSADLKPRVLQATGSGGDQFKWLVGSKGEYWQATPTSSWVKDLTPAVTNPARDWNAVARQSSSGTPLALVTGNEGTNGVILRETSPGKFAELTFANTTLRSLVTNSSDLTALAIGDGGKLLRSTNGGASFANVSVASTTADLLAADISSNTGTATTRTAVIGASGARIFRSANGGSTWSAASISAPGFTLGDIVSVAIEGARGLAVDSNGILLSTANSGTTWTAAEQGFTRSPIRSIARSGSEFWALTENGEIHYRIPDGGLQTPPLTILDDQLDLGNIPTTTPGPHPRTTGLTNAGTTTLNLTLTPSGSAVTVTPATVSIAPGQTIGVRVSLATTSAVGPVSGSVLITGAGFSKPLSIQIGGRVQNRTWAVATRFTTSDLIDTETRDANVRHALSSTHFYQTLNRGTLWTERALPTGSNRAMFFTSSTTGVVVGGSASLARIYRTTDSGATWSTVHSESRAINTAGRAVMDVHLRSTNVGYAITRSGLTIVSQFRAGQLLRTTDGGSTWTAIAGPASDPDFSGVSVHAVSDTLAFVAANNTIWTYNFTTNLWTAVRTFGSPINRVRFATDNTTGWIVGENSLFAVTTSGGATSGSWGPFLELFPSNGSFDGLCFDTTGHARTILNRSTSMEVWQQGATGGDPWARDAFPFAVDAATPRGRAIDMASAGGQGTIVGDGGAIWMYDATPSPLPDRSLITAPALDFGVQREAGNPVTLNLTVLNPTTNIVRINDVILENLGQEESFTAALGSVVLNPGTSTVIPVTFSGLASGPHEAVLTVISDNPVGIHSRTRLTALVQAEPAGLVIKTSPPTLSLTVGGSTSTAAAARVIRDGAAGSGELTIGQTLALNAPSTQSSGGVTYKFSNWLGAGGTGPSVIHPAENASRLTEAIYRPFFPVTTVILPESSSPTGGASPGNRPASGAWIRLTGAKLIVPSLREFAVSGEMFLSGQAIQASLASTAFQVPANPSPSVLEVGSGSWLLDWAKGGAFRFLSSSPSVKVFNSDLLPSATASLDFAANGDFGMNFSLPEGFQDITGMMEIAPDGATPAQVGFSFINNNAQFNLRGRLRALGNGQGGWLLDKSVNISGSEAIFPQTLTITTPIPLGAFSITEGTLSLTRDEDGVIGIAMAGVRMTGPLGILNNLGASVDGSGLVVFTQAGPITFGPFQLVPTGGSTRIALNALTGSLAINLPESHLNAVSTSAFADRWPDNTVTLPGFSFDSSATFDQTIPLPSLTIDGIGLNGGGDSGKNHIRFKRARDETLSVFVRDRKTFFDNTADLEFEIRSDGFLRGKFYGEMSFFGLEFGMISMSYSPGNAPFEFQGTFRALDQPMLSVKCGFGSDGVFLKPPFIP